MPANPQIGLPRSARKRIRRSTPVTLSASSACVLNVLLQRQHLVIACDEGDGGNSRPFAGCICVSYTWNADLGTDSLSVHSADRWNYWSAYRLATARSLRNCSAVRRGPYPGVSR